MHILVTGAAGMIGRKFAERLARDGSLAGKRIDKMTLTDVVAPRLSDSTAEIGVRADDVAAPGVAEALLRERPDLIVHLAAIVSGEAETDFEKGYRVNLDGTRYL